MVWFIVDGLKKLMEFYVDGNNVAYCFDFLALVANAGGGGTKLLQHGALLAE